MRSALIALALAIASPARAAPPDPVATATADYAALSYADAVHVVDAAWRAGGNDADRLRRLFAIAGQAAASMNDDEAARLWFERWLCLEPDAALPPGTSPKLTALFAAARDALAGGHLAAHAIARDGRVELGIASDPLGLAAAAHGDGERVRIDRGHAVLPDAPHVELLDRYGNVLVRLDVERELPAVPVPRASEPSLAARWTTWGIAAGGLAVIAGIALGVAYDAHSQLATVNAHSSSHEFADAESLQTRLDAAQWTSRIAAGGAVGAAAIAVWRF